jgi:hypothetical protein
MKSLNAIPDDAKADNAKKLQNKAFSFAGDQCEGGGTLESPSTQRRLSPELF